ncbi:MAG: hypothetical protein ACKOB6_02470, partial [Candidatus Kapaibacterium sp.]
MSTRKCTRSGYLLAERPEARFLLFAIVSLCGFLQGCSQEREQSSLRKGRDHVSLGGTYRVNMVRGNPNGLDPVIISSKLADDIAMQVFDRLITFDSNLVVRPELARTWEITEDGRRYVFHLRTD